MAMVKQLLVASTLKVESIERGIIFDPELRCILSSVVSSESSEQ